MMKISKELTFDAAHMLSYYDGKCNNLHGHTYKVEVEITANELLKDMVMDFNLVKEVLDDYDHAIIFAGASSREAFENELLELCSKYSKKHIIMPYEERPTAENMARLFATTLQQKSDRFVQVTVKVWETPTSYAEYTVVDFKGYNAARLSKGETA